MDSEVELVIHGAEGARCRGDNRLSLAGSIDQTIAASLARLLFELPVYVGSVTQETSGRDPGEALSVSYLNLDT
jgi:hypothetical protein